MCLVREPRGHGRRAGIDLFPDEDGMIESEIGSSPHGASSFAELADCGLSGHYFMLPAGTELPEEIAVIADGLDGNAESTHPRGHHTFYPTRQMKCERFIELFVSLPWQYAGKKP